MHAQKSRTTRWWPLARRALPVVFVAIVAALVFWRARAIDWPGVFEALREYRAPTLGAAAAAALLSYLVYACYDLVGRAYTRHRIPTWRAMTIAAISYAFNLNFGTLVGGMGFRYRLYSHQGLRPSMITRVLAVSVVGNWLGWFCVAGSAFAMRWVPLPAGWAVGQAGLQLVGIVLLLAVIGYLITCAISRRRAWTLRKHDVELPTLRIAGAQVGLAICNWLLMSTIVFVLLQPYVGFTTVQGVLMTSAVASVIVRVPAGLGVIEAVFIALLGDRVGEPRLVAALLAYRAVYYFAPLLLAIVAYAVLEGRFRLRARSHVTQHAGSR
ncbi:MAG TPA: lysylphosphatidylglycerol synthase domain-containing protein [Nevskiaceae bacterium]|nr:lysylphosphatidylglycerol synthase domain-containing protein [Nevskiaceae bacterium]